MVEHNEDCIFCKIAQGEFGTELLFESEDVIAFDDISPVAPVHALVIPRRHVQDLLALSDEDSGTWAQMLHAVRGVASLKGVDESGFRVVANTGKDSGQEVPHVHLHVIGGKKLGRLA